MQLFKKFLVALLLIGLLVIATASTWLYSRIDGALPLLEGKKTVFGLQQSATIERDKQGIATIKAQSRNDVAVALGFVHAQERFFQMDLLRRNSAGELASLFGSLALDYDKSIRRHRFRDRARAIVAQLPDKQIALLKAYTRGVNQGLKYLHATPFEYLLLQQEPVQWSEEDSILTVFSLYIDLQHPDGKRERTLGLMKAVLAADVYAFLNPQGSIWDAAIDDSKFPQAPMPKGAWPSASGVSTSENSNSIADNNADYAASNIDIFNSYSKNDNDVKDNYQGDYLLGSNSWAISGALSATGSAVIANDMHLDLSVPNTWFRASFEYPQQNGSSATITEPIKVTGATLPGTPNIVIGSNGHIAWGFTNSYGDYSDVILLTTNADNSQYLTPTGFKDFTQHKQIIAIKDEKAQEITVTDTIWGPVIGKNHLGKLLAYRWVAHDKQAINLTATELEYAKTVDQAFTIAARAGIPAQNMLVADEHGDIGWTIMGPIPKKKGNVGETPQAWHLGNNSWQGYLTPAQYPQIKNPTQQRLWTANSRVVGGDMVKKLGNGGYALGARSQQIRDNLFTKEAFDEEALLQIGLDDSAIFLTRWQQFILEQVLTKQALAKNTSFAQVQTLLEKSTELSASIDSVSYRLVRNFRINLRESVFLALNHSLHNIDNAFTLNSIRHQLEVPLWQLINQQPQNFMMLGEHSWQEVFTNALTLTISEMSTKQTLDKATWGQQNSSAIKHPLSNAVPWLGYWLDMPSTPLAGDSYMPKVQGKAFGASQRMVVSPGYEESGIFHMPTSQASHPWSPYYRAGHTDWEQGAASAFLPGQTQYTLTLLSY